MKSPSFGIGSSRLTGVSIGLVGSPGLLKLPFGSYSASLVGSFPIPSFSSDASICVLIFKPSAMFRTFKSRGGSKDEKQVAVPPVYHGLSEPSNIRLIHIAPGAQHEPIALFMFEASPNDAYQALSYVWGDPRVTLPITLNDRPFKITANLHTFLRRLRHPTQPTGPFWADAICINQKDNEEKSIQVTMMDKIYSSASRAIVWLGEEEEDTHLAFELINTIAGNARRAMMTLSNTLPPQLKCQTTTNWAVEIGRVMMEVENVNQILHELYMESASPDGRLAQIGAWKAAYKQWSKPWFSRIWTVQEFMLPNFIDILCGSRVLDTSSMSICSTMIVHAMRRNFHPPSINLIGPANMFNVISGLRTIWLRDLSRIQPRISLLEMVVLHRDRHASDPRDKIFALSAITQPSTFGVDYSKTVQEVYCSFATEMIKEGKIADIFQNAYSKDGIKDLPSWVPDWSVITPVPTMGKVILARLMGASMTAAGKSLLPVIPLPHGIPLTLYKGAGGTEDVVSRFSNNNRSLYLHGIILDTITRLIPSEFRKTPSSVSKLLDTLSKDMPSLNIIRSPGQTREEALYRTFTKDTAFALSIGDTVIRIPPDVSLSKAKAEAGDDGKATISVPRIPDSSPFNRLIMSSEPQLLKPQDIGLGKILFITKKGYIGIARKDVVKKGDVVALIKGVRVPVVLRTVKQEFQLKDGFGYGTCSHLNTYVIETDGNAVHAIMDGEVMADVRSGKLKWREIEIR